jgi:colanic acid biosynthesis glycosyl transferase WcaI
MPEIWSLCDLVLVPLRDTPVFRTVIPSKIFECMGMGIPVLMFLPEGEATAIVRDSGCGVCVPPEKPEAMAAAIEDLSADREKRDRLAAAASAAAPGYSRDELAASMLAVLQRCSGKIDG